MATTADKLRDMRRNAGKNHDENLRTYYDQVNAQERGMSLPYAISGDVYVAQNDGRMVKLDVN
ncbi:hypothetical protein [Marinobacter goseongensis]|uniref:hypothetical protein n=1 Tax=Marinobacter goseongensis TaxID=453838 RepID=UPI00200477A1|nr:hypothetical protein [Marinobacter goseongensis]MCK7552786.1 hypothetical protein [Marinobacter goseongensis]